MSDDPHDEQIWSMSDLRPFDRISSPIWVFDITGRAMWWANRAALRLWNAPTLEALLDRDYASDMSEATKTRLDDYLVRFVEDETIEESWTFYPEGKSAVSVDMLFSGILIDEDGGRLAMLCEAEHRRSNADAYERRAVEALRHTGVVVSLFDAEGRSLFENPASLKTIGKAPSPSLWQRFEDPADAHRVQQRLEEGLPYHGHVRLRAGTGVRWYGMDVWPTRDPVAGSPALLVNARDISEQREAEAALLEAKHAADRANRAKSVFLANMSHEIRTPMNGVLGMSSLLLESSLTADQRGCVEAIHLSANGLLSVINDVLDLSKIDAQKLTLEQLPLEPREVVEEALQIQSSAAADKGLELASFVDMAIPRILRGDAGRLRQVLTNLLGNAVKFTDRGEVTVRVSQLECDEAIVLLRFEVRDTGIGLSPAARRSVFEPFVQADDSTTRRFGGTGLGLSIARQLTSMMGGEIGVDDDEGPGSTFWFTVRLARDPAAEAASPTPAFAGLRALVVDGHDTSRAALELLLAEQGIDADGCASVESALVRLETAEYSVLMVDDEIQAADGAPWLPRLRAREPQLRMIRLSKLGVRGSPRAEHGIELDGSLTKPVRRGNLTMTLKAALRAKNARADGTTRGPGSPSELHPDSPTGELRILVAEDNRINQMVIRKMLERLGVQVDVVANGEDAVEAVRADAYALVFMDCQMPVLDGYQATKRIRRLPVPRRTTPIVALTASAMAGDRERCLDAGMDDYVPKPVDARELQRLLGRFTVTA